MFFPQAYCTLYVWCSPPPNPSQNPSQKRGQKSEKKNLANTILGGAFIKEEVQVKKTAKEQQGKLPWAIILLNYFFPLSCFCYELHRGVTSSSHNPIGVDFSPPTSIGRQST